MKIETPILRRLGPVPFWRGEQKCLDELERIYRRAAAHARGASAAAMPRSDLNGAKRISPRSQGR